MTKAANITDIVQAITGPGIRPVEYRVLVEPDEVEKVTAGGIIVPDITAERQQAAAIRGTVVSLGAQAFSDWPEEDRLIPGARVLMKKYAGEVAEGLDGKQNRLVQDKEILGVLNA